VIDIEGGRQPMSVEAGGRPVAVITYSGEVYNYRGLLRAAAKDLLPISIFQRSKSAYPATQDPSYEQALRDQLNKLVADGTSPVLDLLDIQRLHTWLNTPIGAISLDLDTQRRNTELALILQDWITQTGVRLDLSI
jgi:asparagine synthase (glutamine-hydrolysing)/amidotransferase